jgi:HEAT repeat protein
MKRTPLAVLVVTALALVGSMSVRAADGEMSLELYQKIKSHFDAMYGPSTNLLTGTQPRSRAEIEKDLRADVAAGKDAIFAALHSPKTIHRELSAQALQYCEDKKAVVAALSKLVTDDPEKTVRRAAAGTLAKVPDAEAVDALMKGLSDAAEDVRGICATALGNIKDTRASDGLLKVINDDDNPMIRLQAAMAMSKIKDPAALDNLKTALEKEKDERVKMAIAGAIRAVMGGNQAKEDEVPTADQAANELSGLASEMKEVEAKLREDRHDQAVQVQGKGIEDKLQQLIEKIEKG